MTLHFPRFCLCVDYSSNNPFAFWPVASVAPARPAGRWRSPGRPPCGPRRPPPAFQRLPWDSHRLRSSRPSPSACRRRPEQAVDHRRSGTRMFVGIMNPSRCAASFATTFTARSSPGGGSSPNRLGVVLDPPLHCLLVGQGRFQVDHRRRQPLGAGVQRGLEAGVGEAARPSPPRPSRTSAAPCRRAPHRTPARRTARRSRRARRSRPSCRSRGSCSER